MFGFSLNCSFRKVHSKACTQQYNNYGLFKQPLIVTSKKTIQGGGGGTKVAVEQFRNLTIHQNLNLHKPSSQEFELDP